MTPPILRQWFYFRSTELHILVSQAVWSLATVHGVRTSAVRHAQEMGPVIRKLGSAQAVASLGITGRNASLVREDKDKMVNPESDRVKKNSM